MTIDNRVLPEKAAFGLRLAVGVGFGLAMAWLVHGYAGQVLDGPHLPLLPAVHKIIYSTLMLSAFIWWAGAGTMRRLSLVAWGVIAMAVIAGLAWYQMAQADSWSSYVFFTPAGCLILPFLFITHEVVSSAERTGRMIAPYPTYFDQAWKHGVQLLLSLLFTGLFWAILWLGATLLGFIGFTWLRDLLGKDWFAWPVSGAAMACAVQLGDVQDKLLVNVRALVLSVLSWLLPVIALVTLLFLGSLCVSGLAPLWKTKAATTTLLGAAVVFVLLINAAYQQGDAERPVNIVMKWAARLSCFLLLAFATLAAYSLWLRVDEYGLTSERVLAGAGVIIACLFGLGYAAAAVWPGRWLARMEAVNITMAFVKLVIFCSLLSPVADPVRLSVADQVARLQSGRTSPDRFDWHQLRFNAHAMGTKALHDLARSGRTKDIRSAATQAIAWTDEERYDTSLGTAVSQPDDLRLLKVVYPTGGTLPATFTAATLDAQGLHECVQPGGKTCSVAMVDLNGDGDAEILVRDDNSLTVFTRAAGTWQVLIAAQYLDDDAVKAFDAGQVSTQPHAWSDLKIGKTTVTVNGSEQGTVRSQRYVVRRAKTD